MNAHQRRVHRRAGGKCTDKCQCVSCNEKNIGKIGGRVALRPFPVLFERIRAIVY